MNKLPLYLVKKAFFKKDNILYTKNKSGAGVAITDSNQRIFLSLHKLTLKRL